MWEPVSHYRSQLWGGSLRVACAPPGVRTGMSINSGGPLRLPAQPHIGSNTRLKLPAPGFGRNCVCAPAGSVVVLKRAAPAGVGAAASETVEIPYGWKVSNLIDWRRYTR